MFSPLLEVLKEEKTPTHWNTEHVSYPEDSCLTSNISFELPPSHSPANTSWADHADSAPPNDALAILQLLADRVQNGHTLARNIFLTYRISINIEIPYPIVVGTVDYTRILKDALEDNCLNKLEVVHDFIQVYEWPKDEIADFICEQLIGAVSSCVQTNSGYILLWDFDMNHDFGLVLQFLQENCSLLGHKIYGYASTLYRAFTETDSTDLVEVTLIVELLIRAHDCFTADCNMEGISLVLKKSREIVWNLLNLKNWKLIVRLLTGVARYTDMSYVFQILMENDQFELLLRKGSCKDNAFKVALLDFLKKFCPENHDLYKIVALHFALFSEVALLWEKEAKSLIRNLILIAKLEMQNNKLNPDREPFILFQNTEGTKISLRKAMENYVHAAEFHLQGEKLGLATEMAKQAELIALQFALLNKLPASDTTFCLLNLNNTQITTLISSELNFEQTILLTEAYNNYDVNWSSILYEQCVVRNQRQFLDDFLHHFQLTDTLVQEIARKFITTGVSTQSQINCMKYILERLQSIHMKYKIASELGFSELVESLLVSGQLVFLKDTVWKKGYKG